MRRELKSADVPKLGVPFSTNTSSFQVVILFGVVGTVAKSPPPPLASSYLFFCPHVSVWTARDRLA